MKYVYFHPHDTLPVVILDPETDTKVRASRVVIHGPSEVVYEPGTVKDASVILKTEANLEVTVK
jgi:hypothetical protein